MGSEVLWERQLPGHFRTMDTHSRMSDSRSLRLSLAFLSMLAHPVSRKPCGEQTHLSTHPQSEPGSSPENTPLTILTKAIVHIRAQESL